MASVSTRELHWKKLGNWIRERRDELHITQVELAELTDTKQPNVSRLEKGEHSATVETLVRVAVALEVTPEFLFRMVIGKKF